MPDPSPRPYQFSLFPLVPQHAHVSRGCVGARARSRTHSGTRPTATATECGCGVPTELRVQTTVPRTHHSVPHSCLAFSRDRSPAGVLYVDPSDRSRPAPPSPTPSEGGWISRVPRDSSKRLLARGRRDASKTWEFEDNREMKARSRENLIGAEDRGSTGRGRPHMRYGMFLVSATCL